MHQSNEFARYSIEELEVKKQRFRKRQLLLFGVTAVAVLIVVIAALIKNNMQVFQLVPFLLISGLAMPILVFNPIRKKIQEEIDRKSQAA